MSVEIICMTCGDTGEVRRVTAGLMCQCGSDDVDIWTGENHQRRLAARSPNTPAPFVRTAYEEYPATPVSTHTPARTDNSSWNVYQGPMPGRNPMSNGAPSVITCPVCKGSGEDPEGSYGPVACRECHGTGAFTPNTEPRERATAPHGYPSTQTTVPFMGWPGSEPHLDPPAYPDSALPGKIHPQAKTMADPSSVQYQLEHGMPDWSPNGPTGPADTTTPYSYANTKTHYPKADTYSPGMRSREQRDYSQAPEKPFSMPGTTCPECGNGPLQLRKDHREDAWAYCPHGNCGPLYNVDKNPEVDPYNLPDELPQGRFRSARKMPVKKTGRLYAIATEVVRANPGLSMCEVIGLSREAIRRY